LGAIIVGVAIVVGINMFGSSALKANEDSVRQDCITIAARIQECYRKPVVLGGVNKTIANIITPAVAGNVFGFPLLGYRFNSDGSALTEGNLIYINENGTFTLSTSGAGINIQGMLKENTAIQVNYLVLPSADPNILSVTMTN